MYAWITQPDPARAPILDWWKLGCLGAPAASPVGHEAAAALLRTVPVPPADVQRVQEALTAALPWLPEDPILLDYGLRLMLRHHLLPPGERKLREDAITQELVSVLGPSANWYPTWQPAVPALQRMAVLTPRCMLADHLRSVSVAVRYADIRARRPAGSISGHERDVLEFGEAFTDAAGGELAMTNAVTMHLLLTPPDERRDMCSLMKNYIEEEQRMSYPLLTDVLLTEAQIGMALRSQAFARGLKILGEQAEPKKTSVEFEADVVNYAKAWMKSELLHLHACMHNDLVTALDEGLDLGPAGLRSKAVLTAMQEQADQGTFARSATWLRERSGHAPASTPLTGGMPPHGTVKSALPDIANVMSPEDEDRAWVQGQAIDLAEGPLATPAEPPPIDRPKARAKLQARTRPRQPSTAVPTTPRNPTPGTKPAPPSKPQPPQSKEEWTDESVDWLMQHAVSNAASFYRDEINDLIMRAKLLGTSGDAAERANQLIGALDDFAKKPPKKETAARHTFGQAEQAIEALRQAIRKAEGDERLRARFHRALTVALTHETLRRGRVHGGKIGCPLQAADWGWVEQRYHRCWHSGAHTVLTEDNIEVLLGADEALALHVTGGSLSRALFDVSVHLWRRRPGATGAPSTGTGPFPRMDERNWYDTYITCTVLHVLKA